LMDTQSRLWCSGFIAFGGESRQKGRRALGLSVHQKFDLPKAECSDETHVLLRRADPNGPLRMPGVEGVLFNSGGRFPKFALQDG